MGTGAQSRKGLTRGQGAILIVLIVAIASVYALLAVMFHDRAPRPSVAVLPVRPTPVPLPDAHTRAQEYAAGWQADAQLVGVSVGWEPDQTGGGMLYPHPSAWTFSYYSAQAASLQIVTVQNDGVNAVRQMPVRQAPVPVEADWGFVSQDMLLTFMAKGGQAFLTDHPQASLRAQLSGREGGRPVWYLSAVDPQVGASLQIKIDALSREVLAD